MGRPSRRSILDVNSTQEPDPKVAGFRSRAQSPTAGRVAAASLTDLLGDPFFASRRTAYSAISSIADHYAGWRFLTDTNGRCNKQRERSRGEIKDKNGSFEPPWKICVPPDSLLRSPARRIL
jgi:hypothetical protein